MSAKKIFYYDLTVNNNVKNNPLGVFSSVKFQETRDQPLFDDKPSKYTMSVVRFTMPTSAIPYQIVPIIYDFDAPSNINKMAYSITLEYNGNVKQVYFTWESQVNVNSLPLPPSPNQRKDTNYYNYYSLYSIQHLCAIINNALKDAFNFIVPFLPVPLPGKVYQAPFFSYSAVSGLFTLNTSGMFLNSNPLPIIIYGNYEFGSLMETSFDGKGLGYNNVDGKDFYYNILDRGNNSTVSSIDPSGFIFTQEQEFDTKGFISRFSGLFMTSTTLPVRQSIQSNDKNPRFGTSIASEQIPNITDFEIDKSIGDSIKGYIHYIPTAEYRRMSLLSDSPITHIDISVYYKDIDGNVFALNMPINTYASIKIIFEEI